MKSKSLLPLAVVTMLGLGNSKAGMPIPFETYQHNLTISLSLSSEDQDLRMPADTRIKSLSQKLKTTKFSNKQMLEALMAQDGDIEEAMGGSIKGWSLVLITNSEGDIVATALVKKNTPPIDVTEYFSAQAGPSIQAVKEKKNSVAIQQVSLAEVEIDLDDLTTDLQGVLNIESIYKEDDELEMSTETIQSVGFTDLSGYWSS